VDTPGFLPVKVDEGPALERALKSRPELRRTGIDLRRIALEMDVARNALLPRLDLQGAIGAIGQDESYRETVAQVGRATGRQWSVGLVLAWAPVGVGARAEVRRLESAVRANQLSREQIVLDVRVQIREAVRAIEAADRQVRASAKFRDLAERSLDVEQRRFLNGLSSNFFVAQRQADLAQARLSELAALIQHERAASDLQLAMGELLEARRLRFEVGPGG
jgi:outer membrane protein TolC